MRFDDQLNPEQLAAVRHGEGPQLVLAGAGTGKTRVITYRIAWLVLARGVEPYRIAAVTFTNKAAREMRERVERLLSGPSEVFVGTFHRFALRLLRRYGDLVGLRRDFSILDVSEQTAVMKEALLAEHLDPTSFAPRAVLARISTAKNRLQSVADFEQEAQGFFETRGVVPAYRAYQKLLREAGAVDFDDMILYAVRLLEEHEELGDRMRRRLRHLLVDEFQDTNYAQLRLIKALCGAGGSLTAVGDEDQSIYRWRGAELDNILSFEKVFMGARVRKLERNYRSTQVILDASGDLVANNTRRRGKRLWTERLGGERISLYRARDEIEEAQWLVSSLRALASGTEGLRYRQMSILVRTNAQTRVIEEELIRGQIPYCLVAGTRFYERAEVKDLIAYLRVVREPRDNLSFRRILNQPPRGIGKATQELLFRESEEMGRHLWEVLRLGRLSGVPARGANALQELRRLIEELREEARTCDLGTLLERIIERTHYADLYRKSDAESQARLENIDELVSAAREFSEERPGPALATVEASDDDASEPRIHEDLLVDPLTGFLDYVALVSDTDSLDTELGVSVMTLHSAKGLEFKAVFLAGLEEGLLPHFSATTAEELEEERRLLYVGMTRAEERLFLSACRRRRVAGRYQDQLESSLLAELPADLVRSHGAERLAPQSAKASGIYRYFDEGSPSSPPSTPSAPRAVPSSAETFVPVTRPTTSRPPPRVEVPATTVALEKGRGVRHPTLGAGVILEVEGAGDNAKLVVYFDHAGKRRLLAKYAGLQPL